MPPPPHAFAIDEGAVHYAHVVPDTGGWAIAETRSAEWSDEVFTPGPLGGPMRDPALFHETLGELLRGLALVPESAALVVPDRWMRLTFAESEELPRGAAQREEVLRFKLRRLVPFRVEDLRVDATLVRPLPGQDGTRLLVGFGMEMLLAQLEEGFSAQGVTLGRITNVALAVLAALERIVPADELVGALLGQDDGYTLTFLHRGEPILHRYKTLGLDLPDDARALAVRRELRLTASFLRDRFPDLPVGRIFVGAPAEDLGHWQDWIVDELGGVPEVGLADHLPLTRRATMPAWTATAPLFGAATLEVA